MSKSRRPTILTTTAMALVLAVSTAAGVAFAQSAEEKGFAVAKAIDARDLGWGSTSAELFMILRNANGQESTRTLRTMNLEVAESEEGDKSLTIFDSPRDVDGTAFLSHTKILDADDQWLYLPALKRVKRISSANKSGPFVGSEFAYEDLLSFEVAKYDYKWLRTEPCTVSLASGGSETATCEVTERYPLYENSGYARQVTWVDTSEWRTVKVAFYDRRDAHLKTLESTMYQEYIAENGEGYWRPLALDMVNHQTNKSTELKFEKYDFQASLSDNDFRSNRLNRVR
jgi:outer membrane lipoprotein-sorting protein